MTLYIGIGVALGVSFGSTAGAVFGNVTMGVAFGPIVGISLALIFWSIKKKLDHPTDESTRE